MTAASDWLDQARRLLDVVVQGQAAPAAEKGAAHGGDCTWCPLCQAAAVVRGDRPDVTAALADVLTATATALRTFAESGHAAAPTTARSGADDEPDAEPPPVVQRIEIA
jgi:hypothetical protein